MSALAFKSSFSLKNEDRYFNAPTSRTEKKRPGSKASIKGGTRDILGYDSRGVIHSF